MFTTFAKIAPSFQISSLDFFKPKMEFKKVLIALSLILLVAAAITLSVLLSAKPKPHPTPNVCVTKACISYANMILKNMDVSADPCEDFNRFTCGNYIKTERIQEDQSSLNTFSRLQTDLEFAVADLLDEPISPETDTLSTTNAKRLYASCMNEELLEENGEKWFTDALRNELGGWPMVQSELPTLDIMDKMIKYSKMGLSPLFHVYVDTYPKYPERSVLRLKQPDWFFSKEYYNNTKVYTAYRIFVLKVVQLMTHSDTLSEKLIQEVDSMLELEKEFAKGLYDEAQKRWEGSNALTLRELKDKFPDFDWIKYVKDGIFSDFLSLNVTENETILVSGWGYLVSATKLYASAVQNRLRDLENLMAWSFVKDRKGYLPKVYKNARLEFDRVFSGLNSFPPRSQTCANKALNTMPYAVGRLYVSQYFDSKSKKTAEEMIANIMDEFKVMLLEVDWMDDISREKAFDKIEMMDIKIGYPEYTYNSTHLDLLYQDYNFIETTYLQNSITILKTDMKNSFSKLREKRNRKDWISGPAVVNAHYNPTSNQICFPAGILQAPFYDAQCPNYLNYGGIGSVIGHEITHGFDDQGRMYDKNGVFYPDTAVGLWTNQTIQNYLSRAKCIVDQYSSYEEKQVKTKLNGYQTQGENIADNGGIKESYRAYQKWVAKNGQEPLLPGLNYTQNQLFFINFGQVWCAKFRDQALVSQILNGVHSPGEFRILGTTSNYEEFAKAFQCKPNQANNPTKKCAVW